MPAEPPARFVEPCAGLANVSIRLQGGGKSRGPVGRMGSKAKYADVVLRTLGLEPGLGAGQYLWAEADPAVRSVLRAYTQPDVLAGAIQQMEWWLEGDPLLLWDRLRREGPITETTAREVARWVTIASSNRLINVAWSDSAQCFTNTAEGGSTFGGPDFGSHALGRRGLERLIDLRWPDVQVVEDAAMARPTGDADLDRRTVVYIDPPYIDTAGYGFEFTHRQVTRLALRWAAAGALVAISEAQPIASLARMGWHVVDITRKASGRRTHFSKQQREVLTISRRPRAR